MQKTQEGDVRGRVVPRKEAVELATSSIVPRKKRNPIAQTQQRGLAMNRNQNMSPVERPSRWSRTQGERSLSRYSPAPKTSSGWRLDVWFLQVGSMGLGHALPPFRGRTRGLSWVAQAVPFVEAAAEGCSACLIELASLVCFEVGGLLALSPTCWAFVPGPRIRTADHCEHQRLKRGGRIRCLFGGHERHKTTEHRLRCTNVPRCRMA